MWENYEATNLRSSRKQVWIKNFLKSSITFKYNGHRSQGILFPWFLPVKSSRKCASDNKIIRQILTDLRIVGEH